MTKKKRVHILNDNKKETIEISKDDKIYVDDLKDDIEVIDKNKQITSGTNKTNEKLDDSDLDDNDIEQLQVIDDEKILENVDKTSLLSKNEKTIKNIVYEEFSKLMVAIEGDFVKNYNRKRHNFLLSQLEETITANMVFVSSFESKSGLAIERVAERVARLKYGEENVPSIINPRGLDIPTKDVEGQFIVTDINLDDGRLKGKISEFRAARVAKGRGKNRVESGVNQESIKELISIGQKYKINEIFLKPVDLAFFDGDNWNILELKAGGDLDSSNAPSNIEKLLSIYTGINIVNSKIYFATLYNKDGEGNTWTGAVKRHIAFPEMFLIGKKLWEKILPEDITYERFTELYKIALVEIDLNERIKVMIRRSLE